MDTQNNKIAEPPVYQAVRAVGILKPKFEPGPQGKIFADQLHIRGTAFWLKKYSVLITCAHVVKDLVIAPIEFTGLLVVGNRGNYLRANVGLVDFEHDLAVLVLPKNVPPVIIDKETQSGLEIVNSYPNVGEQVCYAGFPLGLQLLNSTQAPTFSEGVIGAQLRDHKPRKEIQITGPVVDGFSGSPIVLKEKNKMIIGVVANSPSKAAGDANIFMAISWEHVKALAELAKS